MTIPRAYQRRLDAAARRRRIIALGFWHVNRFPLSAGGWSYPWHSSRAQGPGDCYFAASDDGLIKIGTTFRGSEKRVRNMRSPGGARCRLLAYIPSMGDDFEAFMLHYFEGFRVKGEWFEPEPPLLAFIDRVNRVFPQEAAA